MRNCLSRMTTKSPTYSPGQHVYIRPAWEMGARQGQGHYQAGEPTPATVIAMQGTDNCWLAEGHLPRETALACDGTLYHVDRIAHGWRRDGDEWVRTNEPEHSPDASPPIVAYREKPSMATVGILRFEFRARRLDGGPEPEIAKHCGPSWRWNAGHPDWVLERRRLLDGVVTHDWEPQGFGQERADLADSLDSDAVILDPELAERDAADRAIREAEQARQEQEQAAAREAERAAQAKRAHVARSDAAFQRLHDGPHGDLAREWNAFTAEAREDAAFIAHASKDDSAKAHVAAVRDSVTVPSKRKAIREALAYLRRLRLLVQDLQANKAPMRLRLSCPSCGSNPDVDCICRSGG